LAVLRVLGFSFVSFVVRFWVLVAAPSRCVSKVLGILPLVCFSL
jgi:hypothetical protein